MLLIMLCVQTNNCICIFLDCSEKKPSLTTLVDITNLKKLCNHPDLIYEKVLAREGGFENAHEIFPANHNPK